VEEGGVDVAVGLGAGAGLPPPFPPPELRRFEGCAAFVGLGLFGFAFSGFDGTGLGVETVAFGVGWKGSARVSSLPPWVPTYAKVANAPATTTAATPPAQRSRPRPGGVAP
jgi:hypothetical protein